MMASTIDHLRNERPLSSQNARRKQMLFQQMPEIYESVALCSRGAECQPCRLAHRGDLVRRFSMAGSVVRPVLQRWMRSMVSSGQGFLPLSAFG